MTVNGSPIANGNAPEARHLPVGNVHDVKQAQKTLLDVRPDYPNSFLIGWAVE